MRPDDLSCSRNARPENDLREQADRSSCSQNAHDKNVLVRCAQWKISQPPSLERNEQAWKEHVYRSMRAREASPFHPATSWGK